MYVAVYKYCRVSVISNSPMDGISTTFPMLGKSTGCSNTGKVLLKTVCNISVIKHLERDNP